VDNKIDMMDLDYKQGLALPTIGWTITEGDLRKYKIERNLQNVYRDVYLDRGDYYRNNDIGSQDFQWLGTAPVRDAYWGYAPGPYVWKDNKKKPACVKTTQITPPEVLQHFDKHLLSTPTKTMVFRRFPNLMPPEEALDILVKALLGFPQPMGYKQGSNSMILNDSWMVNLRPTKERENIMIDAFLRGFGHQFSELKKSKESYDMNGIDVSDELRDLLKVYTDAEAHLLSREKSELDVMTVYMKRYLEIQGERKKVTDKLSCLKKKIADGQAPKQEDCDCGEGEEEE